MIGEGWRWEEWEEWEATGGVGAQRWGEKAHGRRWVRLGLEEFVDEVFVGLVFGSCHGAGFHPTVEHQQGGFSVVFDLGDAGEGFPFPFFPIVVPRDAKEGPLEIVALPRNEVEVVFAEPRRPVFRGIFDGPNVMDGAGD